MAAARFLLQTKKSALPKMAAACVMLRRTRSGHRGQSSKSFKLRFFRREKWTDFLIDHRPVRRFPVATTPTTTSTTTIIISSIFLRTRKGAPAFSTIKKIHECQINSKIFNKKNSKN